ncbi:MAG: asparagine synthase (glutamine-hydrolyzing) [Thiohalocapsa sp.]
MCGVAGVLLREPTLVPEAVLAERGRAMAAILRHRGPDGWGCWTAPGVALVHTRLAIIDTSDAAAQPMHDIGNTVHVVFNGEIYNFLALRAELIAAGYRFRNRSDTEVIVNGYRHWGTGLFTRLTGMFAIAIWDSAQERLVLARDRFGEKPLYYRDSREGLLFASEIKGILTWPKIPRVPNLEAVHDFFSFGCTLGSSTAFAGIKRLKPAHFMVCARDKAPVIERYWRLPEPGENPVRGNPEDLKRELIERVRAAVEMCLISDVPLGAFLSGGVDSSAVVSMMAQSHGGGIETFSSGFGFGDYDETRFAEMVAERYRTNHHKFVYGSELIGNMADLAWHYGEPFSDSSSLVTYALSRETRQTVTVALTGDGADENLLGYARYFRYAGMRRRTPPEGGRRVPELYEISAADGDPRRPASDTYGYLMETFRESNKLVGYDLAMLPYLDRCSYDRFLPHIVDGVTPEEQAGRIDVATYLPDDLLVKVDIAAMAHGLETRAPFLNHELVEWVVRIPGEQKVWDDEGKALLKAALEPYLPHECMYRTKVGFRVPVRKFMREEIRAQTEAVLLSERFCDRRIMRPQFVREMLAEHVSGQQEHGTRLWNLLALEMWFRTWIDSDSNRPLGDNEDPFREFAADDRSPPQPAVAAAPELAALPSYTAPASASSTGAQLH